MRRSEIGRTSGRARPGAAVGAIVLAVVLVGAATAGGAGQATSKVKVRAYALGDATATASAKKVGSTVKVRGHAENTVKGSVNSRKKTCEKGRLASLIEIRPDGALIEVDREKTTRKGKFALEGPPLVPGRGYFVGVGKKTITKFRVGKRPRKTVCKQEESKPFGA